MTFIPRILANNNNNDINAFSAIKMMWLQRHRHPPFLAIE